MQIKISAALVLGAAIVLAALVMALSPLLWTDHYVPDIRTASVPSGCSIETKPVVAGVTAMFVAHCPVWVQYP